MIRQLFKIIWKQRRYNSLMMIEITFSFIALFALASIIFTYIKRYQKPLGMNYKNMWIINAHQPWDVPAENRIPDSIQLIKLDMIKKHLKATYPEILEVTKITSRDVPYIQNISTSCTKYKKADICFDVSQSESDFAKTFDIKIIEGRWITSEDGLSGTWTVTINKKLKEKFFGDQPAAGKTIYVDDEKPIPLKVVGVFEGIKRHGEFEEEPTFLFEAPRERGSNPYSGFAIKLKENITNDFEAKLTKELESVDKSFKYRIEKIESLHSQYILSELAPLIIIGSIVLFLIVNVMLGLFGTLWLNISRRKSEIGLRLAVGSSSQKVLWQLLGETYCLALLAIVIGMVFTSQIFIFNIFNVPVATLVEANLTAIFLILFFCTISAYAPGKLAASLEPAEALHEE